MFLDLNLNYADLAIGVMLALGFIRGFLAGFWASVLNLAGTFASFIGAYFLTAPAVNYLERASGWVTRVTAWWDDIFLLIPNYSKAYDPNAVATFAGIDSTPWLRPISALIKIVSWKSRPLQGGAAGVHPVFLNGADSSVRCGVFHSPDCAQVRLVPVFQDHCVCHCIVAHPKDTWGAASNRPLPRMVVPGYRGTLSSSGAGDSRASKGRSSVVAPC